MTLKHLLSAYIRRDRLTDLVLENIVDSSPVSRHIYPVHQQLYIYTTSSLHLWLFTITSLPLCGINPLKSVRHVPSAP